MSSNQIACITAPNLLTSSMRITKLTLMIDNSTHQLPYPFTYQPDPIITNIEPAESFVSGGRLLLISGHHLASPQSTKLMVYHEHKNNIINGTSCITQNDTLITCLTPALSREALTNLMLSYEAAAESQSDREAPPVGLMGEQQPQPATLSYESGGLKLKMMLIMDDVKSVRNLDEYYHHLPHYLTYFEDPQLFRLPTQLTEYSEELIIPGENLRMKQLDQDMLITIGSHVCLIKAVQANQVLCEPPKKIGPVYDDNGRLMDKPMLPIIGLIGSNLRYQIGHMQYSSHQYQLSPVMSNAGPDGTLYGSNVAASSHHEMSQSGRSDAITTSLISPSLVLLILLSAIGFVVAFSATFMFAMARFRQSKAEREYKRIQLQMGSLDMNGQPVGLAGGLFDKIHLSHANNPNGLPPPNGQSMRSRAIDYVGGALSGKKIFHQFNQQMPSFPPSPLTDISSLVGSSPAHHHHHHQQQQQQQQQQHLVKLAPNGTIINATTHHQIGQQQQQQQYSSYGGNNTASSSSQSSPGSARNTSADHLPPGWQINHNSGPGNNLQAGGQQQQHSSPAGNKCNLLSVGQSGGNSRNFNWTQEAPSTIVPYAVIEACSLTLEGKNAIKKYV